MERLSTSRRGALTLGGVLAFAGCSAVAESIGRIASPYEHNADAPIGEMAGSWPLRGADVKRRGATEEPPPDPDATVHSLTPVSEHRPDQPVLDSERVYIGVNDVKLDNDTFSGTVAVDRFQTAATSPYAWRNRGKGATPTAVRDSVLFEARNRSVYAVNASDGSVYWRNNAGSNAAVPVGDTVFTSGEKAIEALDAVTGEHLWSSKVDVPALWPIAVVEEVDALLLAVGNSGEGAFYCFNRTDGTVRWRYDAVGESYAMPVSDGSHAFTVGTDGTLHAVHLESGEQRWTYSFERESYERAAMADGTVFAVGTNDDELVALDAASGKLNWRVPLDVGIQPSPTVAGDFVLLQAELENSENSLHVFDRQTGRLEYGFQYPRFRPGGTLVQPVVADGTAYVVGEHPTADGSMLYEIR